MQLYAKFSRNSGYCQFWPLSIVQPCQDERQGGTEIQFWRTIPLDPILLRGLPQKIYLNNFLDLCKKLFPAKRLLLSNQPLMLMHPLSNTRFLPQSQYIYSISEYISIHFQYIINTSQYINLHIQYIYNTTQYIYRNCTR